MTAATSCSLKIRVKSEWSLSRVLRTFYTIQPVCVMSVSLMMIFMAFCKSGMTDSIKNGQACPKCLALSNETMI